MDAITLSESSLGLDQDLPKAQKPTECPWIPMSMGTTPKPRGSAGSSTPSLLQF